MKALLAPLEQHRAASSLTHCRPGRRQNTALRPASGYPSGNSAARAPGIPEARRSRVIHGHAAMAVTGTPATGRVFPDGVPIPLSLAGCRHVCPWQGVDTPFPHGVYLFETSKVGYLR